MSAVHKQNGKTNTVCGLTLRRFAGWRKVVTEGWIGVNCLNCLRRRKLD